ncbi:DNA polymerase-1 [Streptosporangium becharense]|uniref:DNA polymerase I n=1 Tax=Streptosporangium becharense TaxID=1816182 RepID=A0A7W9MFC1_9ACTN|nr:DNA polymerase I [Streptosporangium becharense]MBB2912941.1 DNA polymerase-1 [Streptosporangium becharense]MBB5818234.1 DNA polymerase-1 [Streptosporangium becharense]
MPKSEATPDRPCLLLLDGHSLAYRAFYALPEENFSTTTGQKTNAVYGFTSMLVNVLRDERPTHVAVCFDRSEPTFRHEEYSEYKANRSASPDSFRSQVSLIHEMLDALRVPHLSLPGYEADDLIATLATQASAREMDVLIVTGDRDALQLVDERVTVLMTRVGISNMTRFTPEAVLEKYELTPAQYPDFAAIRGDSSDNLKNIPGVGEKTAAKWIREFGSLEELVNRVDEVKGKVGDKLREHLDQVLMNRRLTQLIRDVPLERGISELELGPADRDEINKILDTLEFRGEIRDRLFKIVGSAEPTSDEGFEGEVVVLGPGDVAAWLRALPEGRAGLAFRGEYAKGTGRLDGIAVAASAGTGGRAAAFLDPAALTEDDETALREWLADPARPKAVHDAKGPMLALWSHGMELRGLTCDTALAAYLAMPGQRAFPLEELVRVYLGRELRAEAGGGGQVSLFDEDDDAARELALRALAVTELADALEAFLEPRGGTGLLRDVELPLVTVLAEMERAGIAADREYLEGLETEFAAAVKQAVEAAHASVGEQFNLGSTKQLQELLFVKLNLPKTKKTKTGYTTDAEALAWLAAQTEHELPTIMLRHRDQAKLKVTVEGLIKEIADDGRIHTTFNQTVAATGRLSSEKPNLQNIPIRTAEGRRIRQGFVVGSGGPGGAFETLLTADYSQIELRIMAHLSGDESLIAAFESGHDFHKATAARVFGIEPEQVNGEMRAKIKAMNYGLAYGLSDYGLAAQLNIPTGEARTLKEEYFQEFGGVRDFLNAIVARARNDGYTETMMGRRRYLPDLNSDNRQRREIAERMALNAPIQGSAADIIKVAMLNVHRALKEAGLTSRMLLQVHDELVFEVAPGELEPLRELVVGRMNAACSLRVPLEVSVGVGRTWEDAGH